jgi:TetR/AcrR family transcriptional regulator, transcriptional repressor of aconitase
VIVPKVSAQYRDERRAHILAAARRCFVRDGFHQTSMQDLLREAGMSSGAVYRYFDGKDSMIAAIAEENLDQIVAIVQESVHHGADLGAVLAAALEFVTARHADDGFAAIALVVWAEALRNPELAGRLRQSFDAATQVLAAAVPASSSPRPELAPDVLANALICVLPGYLLQVAVRGADAVALIPNAVRELFPGILAGNSR